MSNQYTLKITAEEAKEMPMVDLAFLVLKAANTPFYYRDLMQEVANIKQISESEMMQVIAQLYTEINIDGRFACVGTNLWGLKRWYPIEKAEDPLGNTQRPRIINDEEDEEDEEEVFDDEVENDDYDGDKDSDEEDDYDDEVDEDTEVDDDLELDEDLDDEMDAEEVELIDEEEEEEEEEL